MVIDSGLSCGEAVIVTTCHIKLQHASVGNNTGIERCSVLLFDRETVPLFDIKLADSFGARLSD